MDAGKCEGNHCLTSLACDHKCLSCGETSSKCLSCPEGKILDASAFTCLTCSEYSVGLIDSPFGTGCVEICGDGLDFGNLECDDGNTDDKDGCSSTCEVEYGF